MLVHVAKKARQDNIALSPLRDADICDALSLNPRPNAGRIDIVFILSDVQLSDSEIEFLSKRLSFFPTAPLTDDLGHT